jgi:hypothetical protein
MIRDMKLILPVSLAAMGQHTASNVVAPLAMGPDVSMNIGESTTMDDNDDFVPVGDGIRTNAFRWRGGST